MRPQSIAVVATLLWLLCALAIDHWVITPYCPACTSALALELKVKLPAADIEYPAVSILVLFCIPMFLLALWLIPWREYRSRVKWKVAVSLWMQPLSWMLAGLVLTVLGESFYLIIKDYLPKAITTIAESFSITATITSFKDYKPLTVTASLSGLLGFVLGLILFLNKGFKDIFD